ncbi:DUF6093 family protein [Subtercola sp. YIM 133946]|uniref:DUF6093 family protein n=1 Tax=Subtercola sp. YIM 133946 TaxID=3118909 RepID=UPI002F947214
MNEALVNRAREMSKATLMTDECVIGFKARTGPMDQETGRYPEAVTSPVYSGVCHFIAGGTESRVVDTGGQRVIDQTDVVKVPVIGSEAIEPRMIVVFTKSQFDPGLVGVEARISGPSHSGIAASRKFSLEQVS